jgi:hypothetical protein
VGRGILDGSDAKIWCGPTAQSLKIGLRLNEGAGVITKKRSAFIIVREVCSGGVG